MNTDIEKEVVDVLTENTEGIPFEALQSEQYSPLNQAVIAKEIGASNRPDDWNIWKPEQHEDQGGNTMEDLTNEGAEQDYVLPDDNTPPDAPEQKIGSDPHTTNESSTDQGQRDKETEPEFELPTATAKQAADTILGMANNALAVGGGYFIKIRKHKDFYDFDEIIELIDHQNEKNVKRIQLDKEDKALLKPLIVLLLKKKAKKLTPEQQLTGAILSILLKKTQIVMEVRMENEILVDRMLDILKREKRHSDTEEDQNQEVDTMDTYDEEVNGKPEPQNENSPEDQNIDSSSQTQQAYDEQPSLYESVVEIAEDTPKP